MRSPFVVLSFAAVLSLAGCGSGDSREVLLRLKPKAGDALTFQYKTTSIFKSPPNPTEKSTVTVTRLLECTEAEDAKSFWKITTKKVDTFGEGQSAAQTNQMAKQQEGKSDTFTRSDRNVILSDMGMSPLEPEFPVQAVHVGDSWRGKATLQGVDLTMTYTVDRFEKVDGMDAIVITGTSEGTIGVEQVRPITVWYDLATGLPIKGSFRYVLDLSSDSKLDMELESSRK